MAIFAYDTPVLAISPVPVPHWSAFACVHCLARERGQKFAGHFWWPTLMTVDYIAKQSLFTTLIRFFTTLIRFYTLRGNFLLSGSRKYRSTCNSYIGMQRTYRYMIQLLCLLSLTRSWLGRCLSCVSMRDLPPMHFDHCIFHFRILQKNTNYRKQAIELSDWRICHNRNNDPCSPYTKQVSRTKIC